MKSRTAFYAPFGGRRLLWHDGIPQSVSSKRRMLLVGIFLLSFAAGAQVKPAMIFSDNMVLQREQPLHVWGRAVPGKMVVVTFAGQKKSVRTKKDSSWQVVFAKQKATTQPQSMVIRSGKETKTLINILVGDVWLLSGQSNMEWPMGREMHWATEKRSAQQPLIRLINPPPAGRNVYGVAYTDSLNRRLT
ncbi:MAG TPA: hypothetical protein VGE06_02750, partial [Flavisolibacter sp.]